MCTKATCFLGAFTCDSSRTVSTDNRCAAVLGPKPAARGYLVTVIFVHWCELQLLDYCDFWLWELVAIHARSSLKLELVKRSASLHDCVERLTMFSSCCCPCGGGVVDAELDRGFQDSFRQWHLIIALIPRTRNCPIFHGRGWCIRDSSATSIIWNGGLEAGYWTFIL